MPTVITIEVANTEIAADAQATVLIKVLNQRGESLPGVELRLEVEPIGMGTIASEVTTQDDGQVAVIFVGGGEPGQAIITATTGEVSTSITLDLVVPSPTPMPAWLFEDTRTVVGWGYAPIRQVLGL